MAAVASLSTLHSFVDATNVYHCDKQIILGSGSPCAGADRRDLFPLIGNVLLVHRTDIQQNLDTDASPSLSIMDILQ